MFLEKSSLLGDEVTAAFTAVVEDTLAASLREVLLPLEGMEERVKGCITQQDLIKLLPPHHFLPCLKKAGSRTLPPPPGFCAQKVIRPHNVCFIAPLSPVCHNFSVNDISVKQASSWNCVQWYMQNIWRNTLSIQEYLVRTKLRYESLTNGDLLA